ncbi:MAG: FAD-binding protein [Bacteroidia bacterium]|nr:FAD-binding protein [Bacteroidia bacterium]
MLRECTIQISPEALSKEDGIRKIAARELRVPAAQISGWEILRRSIDSRKGKPKFVLKLQVAIDQEMPETLFPEFPLQNVTHAQEAHIIGMGPAGMFAALELIRQGIKPVIIERGKAVRERRRDLAKLNKEGLVNPESNYCFGEGGAGTFSDGKLYTRAKKRGHIKEVLEILVEYGANPDILVNAHPHIGTNKLPKIIQQIRESIIECGGEIQFDSRLTDLRISEGKISHIQINDAEWIAIHALILATGHSARDIFHLLDRHKISFEAKSFAMGVRVEHPQALIDKIQYRCEDKRHPELPAAAYSLVQQVQGKGVYSFCMCPGGIICPASTAEGELVVNGWSPSKRDGFFANSGMVVEVSLSDLPNQSPLAAVEFQKSIEQRAFAAGGGKQVAPSQRLGDFVKGKFSQNLPDCSYLPGTNSADLRDILPQFVSKRLQEAFRSFGRKMKGYLSNEAIILGVESRTSSPVRIPRDKQSLMHPQINALYPCGEGAGYAGGIMSAALDGMRCAKALSEFIKQN